jgi:tritrans,polycis-undecaprenyl-diphosphate synthase [geranylgeranyl-diphosphate specific]
MSLIRKILKIFRVYWLYEKWLYNQIKNKPLPKHVALILDGNRRWALSKGLEPWIGHKYGANVVYELLNWCLELKIPSITLYVLSIENLKRDSKELNELMNILEEKLKETLKDERIHKHKVNIKVIGKKELLPNRIIKLVNEIEESTKDYSNFFLNIALAYGGRAEIIDAVKRIALDVFKKKISIDKINEDIFEKYLYTSNLPKPDPDLIIRTSGEERLSNFLLWQSAYSELVFLDIYWPEFRKIDLLRAIRTYQKRERRYGL